MQSERAASAALKLAGDARSLWLQLWLTIRG
jgi:hypothetical protein